MSTTLSILVKYEIKNNSVLQFWQFSGPIGASNTKLNAEEYFTCKHKG